MLADGAGLRVAQFGGDGVEEALALGGDPLLACPDLEGDLVGGQGGDEEAEQGVHEGGVRDDDAGYEAQGAPDDDGGQDERGVAAAQPGVPSEVLLLGDEDVVGVVDPLGRVVPSRGDALVLGAALPEPAREVVHVGLRDGVAGHGGAPGQVEQRGVEHFLKERAVPWLRRPA